MGAQWLAKRGHHLRAFIGHLVDHMENWEFSTGTGLSQGQPRGGHGNPAKVSRQAFRIGKGARQSSKKLAQTLKKLG